MSIQRCCPPAEVITDDFEPAAALLKAIADPYRLTMLATLAAATDEVCVCDFTDALPLNQPTVSHHLRILREAKLVTSERRGTWVYYRIAPDAQSRIDDVVASVLRQKTPCCGGPSAVDPDACCVRDADAKGAGAAGCGCTP